MPEALSVIIAFFAALGILALVWIIAAVFSAPKRGSELCLFSASCSAGDIEADLRRVAWLRRTGDLHVTLVLLEENLPDELWQTAEQLSRQGDLRLISRDSVHEYLLEDSKHRI